MLMKIIVNASLDPYFNLAAEEYMLDTAEEDVFMLWRNSASVIIGKNQNAYAEVNTEYTETNSIPVVRRLTGGGAVFHDPGNVNFTFITKAPAEPKIDFARFAVPILDALEDMGVHAVLDGRNDIVADGYKISGNAQCVHRQQSGEEWLLHHGTLLYDADLSILAKSLRVNREKLRAKGIQSVSSRVRNIRDIAGLETDTVGFMMRICEYAENAFGNSAVSLTNEEKQRIAAIAEEKYCAWEWNFGQSPEFQTERTKRFSWGMLTVGYTVNKGIITELSLSGDFFGTKDSGLLEKALVGCRFSRDAAESILSCIAVDQFIAGSTAKDIAGLIFDPAE